jgi:hypothetical protein
MPAFPLAGPHRASGLASNVVRRSAAHNFGKNATPAVGKSRLGRRGFQQSHVHPRMRHPLHDTEVSEQIASVRSTEPTVIKIGAPIPLDQSRNDKSNRHADWMLSRYEHNLSFFFGGPRRDQ